MGETFIEYGSKQVGVYVLVSGFLTVSKKGWEKFAKKLDSPLVFGNLQLLDIPNQWKKYQ